MTRREVKKLLTEWGNSKKFCDELEADVNTAKQLYLDALEPLGAQNLDGMPHGTAISRPVERAALLAEARAAEYERQSALAVLRLKEHIELCAHVDKALQTLDAYDQMIIRMRYKQGKSWNTVGRAVHMVPDWARQREAKAIDTLGRLLDTKGD